MGGRADGQPTYSSAVRKSAFPDRDVDLSPCAKADLMPAFHPKLPL